MPVACYTTRQFRFVSWLCNRKKSTWPLSRLREFQVDRVVLDGLVSRVRLQSMPSSLAHFGTSYSTYTRHITPLVWPLNAPWYLPGPTCVEVFAYHGPERDSRFVWQSLQVVYPNALRSYTDDCVLRGLGSRTTASTYSGWVVGLSPRRQQQFFFAKTAVFAISVAFAA